MSRTHNTKSKTSVWLAIGAIILIILLVIWLTVADLTGNTDVAAFLGIVDTSNATSYGYVN